MRKLLTLSLIFLISALFVSSVLAECKTYTECKEQESSIRKSLTSVSKTLESLSKQLSSANYSYSTILGELNKIEADFNAVEKQLDAKKKELNEQVSLRNLLARELYKQNRVSSLDIVLSDDNFSESVKNLSYFQKNIDQVEARIGVLNAQITSYKEDRKAFEEVKAKLSAQRDQLASEIGKINYLTSYYSNQRAILGTDLNAAMQRQALLAWREKESGNGKQSLGGAGSYIFYGYGTQHGVGMSQYGAKMLTGQGKSGEQIIKFYYPGVQISTWNTNNRLIRTSCAGTLSFEDKYLAGIGEILNSWPSGVKEAQIIAARSYAWPHTYIAGSSEGRVVSCGPDYQVYVGGTGKLDAVNATRGKVATYGGSIARLFYHSTSGPHTDSIWDSPSFSASKSSYPYLKRVNYNDTASPLNNWCGIMSNSWPSRSKPPSIAQCGSSVGTPLTNSDLEFILNASLLKYRSKGGHLEDVGFNTTRAQVELWLKQEGTTPIKGLKSISLIRVGGSSDRVAWVTAVGKNRNINSGSITGLRFRYIYNLLSPEKDMLWSIWFYVK